MNIDKGLTIKVSGPGLPPLRVVTSALYRKPSPHNTHLFLTVEHRTTGGGYTVKLDRAAAQELGNAMAIGNAHFHREGQDAVEVQGTLRGYALAVLHWPSQVTDYPPKRRVAYLDTSQRHHVADWLRRWAEEGWS
jgi:hypothetical protein